MQFADSRVRQHLSCFRCVWCLQGRETDWLTLFCLYGQQHRFGLAGNDAIGVITIGKQPPHAFAPNDVNLIGTVAASLSVALQNARLFQETQEALSRQTATADILRVISSSW